MMDLIKDYQTKPVPELIGMNPTFRSKIPDFANFPNCNLPELKIF